MNTFTVWSTERHKDPFKGAKERKFGEGVKEKCLITDKGHYIGIETGKFYPKNCHYHSDNLKARIVSVDDENLTGMYHLSESDLFPGAEENEVTWKRKYLGAIITVNRVHSAGEHQIYRCIELDEFFSDDEIELLKSE